ncbi:hypothetical protein [Rhodoferax sp.]|uniref:hypothetical protein n=1 Tax=Rhodoferax sp. TaxID=50421 RepID=UPI0025DABA0C|nr:hypothetical protein [Rhodoferax sp.]
MTIGRTWHSHPPRRAGQPHQSGDLRVATPGGVFQVRWDENASAGALCQLTFFGEFLKVAQLFERWVGSCPQEHTSPNAPEVRDVLGTWLLSIDTDPVKRWDYAVLVSNSNYEIKAIGQLYRDRADYENGFDELKNPWGWGGYTTQDLERCNLRVRYIVEKIISTKQKNYVLPTLMSSNLSQSLIPATGQLRNLGSTCNASARRNEGQTWVLKPPFRAR